MLQNDLIFITGAPYSWRLKKLAQKLLHCLRKDSALIQVLAKHCYHHKASKTQLFFLSIRCVDAKNMRKLNQHYRKNRHVTDILSFEPRKTSSRKLLAPYALGDLVLCIPVVRAQAKQQKHSIQTELMILMTHGILHLLSFDHEGSKVKAQKMAYFENKILKRLAKLGSGLITRSHVKKSEVL